MAVLTDPISDFLTRLKNASRAGNAEFTAPFSKIKAEIAGGATNPPNPLWVCNELAKYVEQDSIVIGDGGDFVATAAPGVRSIDSEHVLPWQSS